MDTITVYKYVELPTEEAQAKARGQVCDLLHKDFDDDGLDKDFDVTLTDAGYPNMNIRFALNHCQGDGVAFYGTIKGEDVLDLAERLLDPAIFPQFTALHDEAGFYVEITPRTHQYSHFNTMAVGIDCTNDYNDEAYDSDLRKMFHGAIDTDVRKVSKQLEKDGYAEIERQTSDGAVLDAIQDNDQWRFEEDGSMR